MEAENRRFSIVIPNHNRADALSVTLYSLAQQSVDSRSFEVLVVDDGSTDNSIDLIRQLSVELPFRLSLLQQKHQGPSSARNRGAEAARHEILLFWDSDMVADSRMLDVHRSFYERCDRSLVAGVRRPWEKADLSTFAQVIKTVRSTRGQACGASPSFWDAFSANLSIRQEDFWELGGFDDELWAFEDIDLTYRAEQAGLRLVFAQEAIGYHNHRMTLEQTCRQQRFYQRHAAAFLNKHPELEGQIDYLIDKAPVNLRKDSPSLIVRKFIRWGIASRVPLELLKAIVSLAERLYPDPTILAFLYWKIIASYQLMGYREGLRESSR